MEEKHMFYKVNFTIKEKILDRYKNNLRYICHLIHQDMYKFFGIVTQIMEYNLDSKKIYIYFPLDNIISDHEIKSINDASKGNIINFLQYYGGQISTEFTDSYFFQIAFYRKNLKDKEEWTYEENCQLASEILSKLMEECKNDIEVFDVDHEIDYDLIILTNYNWSLNEEKQKKIRSLIEKYGDIDESYFFLNEVKN